MKTPRVAIMAGGRTPFVKSGKAFNDLGPLALAKHAVVRLLETHHVDPSIADFGHRLIKIGFSEPQRGFGLSEISDIELDVRDVEQRRIPVSNDAREA